MSKNSSTSYNNNNIKYHQMGGKMKRPPVDSLPSKYCAQFSCIDQNEKHFNNKSATAPAAQRSVYMIRPPPEFNLSPPPSPLKHISLLFDQDDDLRHLFEFDEKCNSLRSGGQNENNINTKLNTGYVNVIYGGEPDEESTRRKRPKGHKVFNSMNKNHMTYLNKPSIAVANTSTSSSSFFTPHVILFLSCFMFLMIFVLALAVFLIFKRKKTSSGKSSKDSDIVNSDSVFIPGAAATGRKYKRGGNSNLLLDHSENNSQEQYQELLFKNRLNMLDPSGAMYNNILLSDSLSPLLLNGHATIGLAANADPHQVNYLIQNLNNENILLKSINGAQGLINNGHLIPLHGGTINPARFNLLENATSESYEEEDEANVYEQITKYDTNKKSKKVL